MNCIFTSGVSIKDILKNKVIHLLSYIRYRRKWFRHNFGRNLTQTIIVWPLNCIYLLKKKHIS